MQYSNEPCNQINYEYYCKEHNVRPTTTDCIAKIILNKQAPCHLINRPTKESIFQIFSQYLIINKINKTEYSTTCGIQGNRYFTNIKLIKFVNCSITIDGITYQNKIQTINQDLIYLQPFHEIIITNISTPIDLAELTNWSNNNIENINRIQKTAIPNIHHHIYWILSTILIIAIVAYLIIWRYCPTCISCTWHKDIQISSKHQLPDKHYSRNTEDSITLRGEQLHNDTIITQSS